MIGKWIYFNLIQDIKEIIIFHSTFAVCESPPVKDRQNLTCRSNARYAKDDDISLDRACGRTSIVEGIFQAPTWYTCRHPPLPTFFRRKRAHVCEYSHRSSRRNAYFGGTMSLHSPLFSPSPFAGHTLVICEHSFSFSPSWSRKMRGGTAHCLVGKTKRLASFQHPINIHRPIAFSCVPRSRKTRHCIHLDTFFQGSMTSLRSSLGVPCSAEQETRKISKSWFDCWFQFWYRNIKIQTMQKKSKKSYNFKKHTYLYKYRKCKTHYLCREVS